MEFIKFLWQISWKQILISSGAGLIGGGSNAFMLSIINREVHQGHFTNAVFYFVFLAVCILGASITAQFLLIRLSQNAIYELRLQLSQNILAAPLEQLERLRENRLIVMLTDDINTLTRSVAAIPNVFIDLATVIGCFIYLGWVSNLVFVLAITSTIVSILFVQSKLSKSKKLFIEAREEEDTLFKHFQGVINGTKELKLNRRKREDFMEINLRGSADKLRRKNTKAAENFIVANGFGQIAQLASLGFMLFLLPSLVSLPLPILASYVLISTFLALPLQNLLNRMPELVRGNVALQKIERMNLSLINIAEPDQVPALIQTTCQLQLQGVVYRYHPDLPSDPHSHPDAPEADFPPDHPPLPAHELDRDSSFTGDRQHEHPHPSHPDRLTDQQSPDRQRLDRQPPNQQPSDRDSAKRTLHERQHHHPHPPHPQHRPTGSQDSRPNLQHPHPHPQHPQRLPPPHPDFGEQGFKLGPIDLTMRSGELIFIVGSNGSGKSTLAKLITGLYTPRSGQISLNGEAITEVNVEWYRQHFATTFADAYLFDSYLGFDNPQLDREIGKYLQEFQLDQKVSVTNGILSTTSLSQGQRKRLALLTAFLEDRPIYLFDEWASDQDPTFREIFYEQMLIQLKNRGKLVIVITHDDRYFHLADRILQLNYGRVE